MGDFPQQVVSVALRRHLPQRNLIGLLGSNWNSGRINAVGGSLQRLENHGDVSACMGRRIGSSRRHGRQQPAAYGTRIVPLRALCRLEGRGPAATLRTLSDLTARSGGVPEGRRTGREISRGVLSQCRSWCQRPRRRGTMLRSLSLTGAGATVFMISRSDLLSESPSCGRTGHVTSSQSRRP